MTSAVSPSSQTSRTPRIRLGHAKAHHRWPRLEIEPGRAPIQPQQLAYPCSCRTHEPEERVGEAAFEPVIVGACGFQEPRSVSAVQDALAGPAPAMRPSIDIAVYHVTRMTLTSSTLAAGTAWILPARRREHSSSRPDVGLAMIRSGWARALRTATAS